MLDCYCETGCGYLLKNLICFQFMTISPLHLTLNVNSLISAVKEASSSNLRISQFMQFVVCLSHPWPRLRELGVAVLMGKPEGKRPLGRPRRRWVDNIRTDLQEVECGYMDWIGRAQDRVRWRTLVSAVMNLRVP